jgi:hypothetical protein
MILVNKKKINIDSLAGEVLKREQINSLIQLWHTFFQPLWKQDKSTFIQLIEFDKRRAFQKWLFSSFLSQRPKSCRKDSIFNRT